MKQRQRNFGIDCGFDRTDAAEFEMLLALLKPNEGNRHRDWDRMKRILRMRYQENLTFNQIGIKIECCTERTRQLVLFGIRKIQYEIYIRERWGCKYEPEIRLFIKEKVRHFPSWQIEKKSHNWQYRTT